MRRFKIKTSRIKKTDTCHTQCSMELYNKYESQVKFVQVFVQKNMLDFANNTIYDFFVRPCLKFGKNRTESPFLSILKCHYFLQ